MLMKVFGLVFLFIIRFCFPRSQSIADVIRKWYGDKALKNVRKFIEFGNTCHKHNVVPNFRIAKYLRIFKMLDLSIA